MRSETSSFLTVVYLILWIFIGNYIFLNLFLAILLDGFESSNSLQLMEEIEQEDTELEATHKRLMEEFDEKKKKEEILEKRAKNEIMEIIRPEKDDYKEEEVKRGSKACYFVVRDNQEDEDSLYETHLDPHPRIERVMKVNSFKKDPYLLVDCKKAFFYFSKTNSIRLFCANIVSHG